MATRGRLPYSATHADIAATSEVFRSSLLNRACDLHRPWRMLSGVASGGPESFPPATIEHAFQVALLDKRHRRGR